MLCFHRNMTTVLFLAAFSDVEYQLVKIKLHNVTKLTVSMTRLSLQIQGCSCRSEIVISRRAKFEILETRDMKHVQRLNLANIKPQGKKIQLKPQFKMVKSHG